jgi:molybdopterin-guanine dinucleotide biosynthesis protein A
MGQDKALVELAGRPLIEYSVGKLGQICSDVRILSSDPQLEAYAPLVPDLHPGCGPLSGIEAALAQSAFDWNLFLPVDMPFLPTEFLASWVRATLGTKDSELRVSMFTVDGVPQPTLALLHREVRPFIDEAIATERLKLFPVLESAGREIAVIRGLQLERVFRNLILAATDGPMLLQEPYASANGDWWVTADNQLSVPRQWFANINTPQDLDVAQAGLGDLGV